MSSLRKYLKATLLSLGVFAVLIAGFAYLGRMRTWVNYVPAAPADRPALLIVLHGSMGSGQRARAESSRQAKLGGQDHRSSRDTLRVTIHQQCWDWIRRIYPITGIVLNRIIRISHSHVL